MYSYIKVKTDDLNEVEGLLSNGNIDHESSADSMYFSVEERMSQLIENNVIMNNIKNVDAAKEFVYVDFNPLEIDNQIMEKLLIYQSSKEDN